MNARATTIASIFCLTAVSYVQAAEFEEYARVLSVAPQVEQFNQPQQECRTEYVPTQPQRGAGGAILGGLAGGIIGNQVGGGSGRTAATAVGAITGAIVGDRMENDGNTSGGERAVRNCRTIDNWQSRTSGYAVTYDYHGRSYTTVMPYDPGDRVKLRVSITPR